MKKTVLAVLLAGCLCVPVWAEADSAETDTLNATIMNEDVVGNVEAEIEDGILTIRMEASEMGKEGFWWEYLQDEADPHVELLTQSTEEEDLDYAGSFRGLEDGESLLRLVYTNGVYVYQYIEFYVKVENGAITERTGGGYAYPDSEGFADILLAIDPSARTVEITFIDSGIPYNPLAKEDPDVTLAAKDRQIGGLGIFMVKKSMDDVRYEYKDGQNILTIVKKI